MRIEKGVPEGKGKREGGKAEGNKKRKRKKFGEK